MYAFTTALSALKAHEEAVDVIGNNLANLNTAAFKSSGVEFSDIMSRSTGAGGAQVGMGVNRPRTVREFSQGPIQSSGRLLDAAIQGSGFFIASQNGKEVYSRVGSFKLAADGTLVTQAGDVAMGWSAVNGEVNTSTAIGPLRLSVGALLPPRATSNIAVDLNLNAQTVAGQAGDTVSAPVEIVDSLGVTHVLTIQFTKEDDGWSYAVQLPEGELGEGGTVEAGRTALSFDENGKLVINEGEETDEITISGLASGAADMTITWNLIDTAGAPTITQLAAASSVGGIYQDGFEPSELTQVSIGDGGMILAEYSNGQQKLAGQLAIASIRNPETLMSIGGNCYMASAETAAPAIGISSTGGRGEIIGGATEGSNVDIAREFTNLIVFQRGYQANARVITTANEISQETINLKR